jgi:predicted dehydrogenase
MSHPLRLGVLGAGTISQLAHLPAAEIAEGVEVTALGDSRADLLARVAARRHVQRTYASVEELLGDETVEAVDLCVPTIAHDELAVMALRAGKHVLCEKPMASTVPRAERMIEAARDSGRTLMIGHHKRFDPGCEQACEVLRAGRIGQPRLVIYHFGTGNWTEPAPERALTSAEPAPPWEYEYPFGVDDPRLRAYWVSLLEMFTHMTNLLRWLVGDPDWILSAQPAQNVVRGTLTLGWGDDAADLQAFCVDGPHYPVNTWNEVLTVWGDEGRVEVVLPPNVYVNKPARVRIFDAGTGADTLLPEVYGWAFAREIEHFAHAVRHSEPVRTPPEDSLKDLLIAQAAIEVAAGSTPAPRRLEYGGTEGSR